MNADDVLYFGPFPTMSDRALDTVKDALSEARKGKKK